MCHRLWIRWRRNFVQVVDEAAGVGTNQSKQYQYTVHPNGVPLRITLVWTDTGRLADVVGTNR